MSLKLKLFSFFYKRTTVTDCDLNGHFINVNVYIDDRPRGHSKYPHYYNILGLKAFRFLYFKFSLFYFVDWQFKIIEDGRRMRFDYLKVIAVYTQVFPFI